MRGASSLDQLSDKHQISKEYQEALIKYKDYSGVTVDAMYIAHIIVSFRHFQHIPVSFLRECGIDVIEDAQGGLRCEEPWLPIETFLYIQHKICDMVGVPTAKRVGQRVALIAPLPDHVLTLEQGLGGLDMSYHVSHRVDGQLMFNMDTGEMLEGIGHYAFSPGSDRQATMRCDNPYPCGFDEGVIHGLARRFQGEVSVKHEGDACRLRGDDACVYQIRW